MKARTSFGVVCCAAGAISAASLGCGGAKNQPGEPPAQRVEASADLEARSGSTVVGKATLAAEGDKVILNVEIKGARPGEHAIHIHENPDCSSEDAKSAGEHWNPTGQPHGKWGHDGFHLGDIGNITVGADGNGRLSFSTDLWTLGTARQNDVIGRSIVVHENVDDFQSQPAGNAGARVSCGVIRRR